MVSNALGARLERTHGTFAADLSPTPRFIHKPLKKQIAP